ncbi:melanoma antigen preferentially expressed in tumors-like [Nannospalax galili]|nr:melanoma antigen preferentially expressed in tumors-like [Nannospalax galili]
MDHKEPDTLFDLATQSLLSNERAAIHALGVMPRKLFVPFFNAAFLGGHKNILMATVKMWPFPCLHMGTLKARESQCELVKTMVESLQVLPAQDSASWNPKLRILDLRENAVCRNVCPESHEKSHTCFHSCAYFEHTAQNTEAQCNVANAQSEVQSSRHSVQLIVDLSLDGTLRERTFFSLLLNKVEQSLGSLHLCCRDLKINKLYNCKNTLRFLNLKCVNHLAVEIATLNEVTKLLSLVFQLDKLSLSKITCTSFNGKAFKDFTAHLNHMSKLKELTLSSFCLTDHIGNLLRGLPLPLDCLSLPLSGLSSNDFKFLSQCPQTNYLTLLNLSDNRIFWGDCEPFQDLLEKVSGTLRHLEIDHCLITDSVMSVIIPALSHCSQLRVFSFASNPITMSMLTRILHHLTHLTELKYVVYPIPVHCFLFWPFQDRLDIQQLADVQVQLKRLLTAAQRTDMKWITYSD